MALVPATYREPAPTINREALAPPRPATEVPKGSNLMGALLVLAADGMVLATLLATWFTLKAGTPHWPATKVSLSTYLPTMVTVTAVMSAFSVQWLVSSIRRNDQRSGAAAAVLTVVLGLAVVNAQWYSMVRAKMAFNGHAYSTLYYLLIGYHAVHVALGIGAVILVGSRAVAGHFGRKNYDAVRATAAFWYYGTAAWAVIVSVLFLFSPHHHA
jgi:heme/copper-type cytochrome/quinol oxidase subunit 3